MRGWCRMSVITGLCCFLLLLLIGTGYAEENPNATSQAPKSLEELSKQLTSLEEQNEVYQALQEEIKNYREYLQGEMSAFREGVQKEREELKNTFTIFISLITLMFTVGGVILYFTLGQSRNDIDKRLDEIRTWKENQLKQALREAEKDFSQRIGQIHQQAEDQFKGLVSQEVADIKQRITALHQMINNEMVFTSTRILVIATEDEITRMQQHEFKTIRDRGITQVHFMTFDQAQLERKLNAEECDILIYRYLNRDETPFAAPIADLLRTGKHEIPFIVYNYQGSFLDQSEKQQVETYLWSIMANYPVSLVGHLFSLAYAFNQHKRK
ncbi:hypothetical protein [Laceyella putida]|uniref:Uncharacterized protein n=1 Tax=Laceyella putida TaxID=110101 RepID=A0ABW2RLR1_9BACL